MPESATLLLAALALALAALALVVFVVTVRPAQREAENQLLARAQALLELQERLVAGEQEMVRHRHEFWAPVQEALWGLTERAGEVVRQLDHSQTALRRHEEQIAALLTATEHLQSERGSLLAGIQTQCQLLERIGHQLERQSHQSEGQHHLLARLGDELGRLRDVMGGQDHVFGQLVGVVKTQHAASAEQRESLADLSQQVRALADLLTAERAGRADSATLPDTRRVAARDPAAEPEADRVSCTVFAPPEVASAEAFLVQVFAHTRSQAPEAARAAREFDPAAGRRAVRALRSEVRRGTTLAFHLSVPGAAVSDPVQELDWWGEPEAVQFAVEVPSASTSGTLVGTVLVSLKGVPVGHLKFKLTVAPAAAGSRAAVCVGEGVRYYRNAFVSYAARDRSEVLKRVQMLAGLGVRYFQDVLDLEPGDRWERELYRHIDESDVFLLFWSTAASESEWVRKELAYAIRRKAGDDEAPPEVLPVVIEGPPVPPPPDELAHLHFNDYLLYLMQAPTA